MRPRAPLGSTIARRRVLDAGRGGGGSDSDRFWHLDRRAGSVRRPSIRGGDFWICSARPAFGPQSRPVRRPSHAKLTGAGAGQLGRAVRRLHRAEGDHLFQQPRDADAFGRPARRHGGGIRLGIHSVEGASGAGTGKPDHSELRLRRRAGRSEGPGRSACPASLGVPAASCSNGSLLAPCAFDCCAGGPATRSYICCPVRPVTAC